MTTKARAISLLKTTIAKCKVDFKISDFFRLSKDRPALI